MAKPAEVNRCGDCVSCIKVMKHPWNDPFAKGKISEQLGWACKQAPRGAVVFMSSPEGECELFIPKKKKKAKPISI